MNESELQSGTFPADTQSMSPLPKFHAKATKDAEEAKLQARLERDRAKQFLDSLDEILGDSNDVNQ